MDQSSSYTDRPPIVINGGVQYRVLIKPRLRDIFNIAFDFEYIIGDMPSLKLGAEYIINGLIAIRLGYKRKLKKTGLGWEGITAGFGVHIKRYELEYAFQTFGKIDAKGGHQISINLKF